MSEKDIIWDTLCRILRGKITCGESDRLYDAVYCRKPRVTCKKCRQPIRRGKCCAQWMRDNAERFTGKLRLIPPNL